MKKVNLGAGRQAYEHPGYISVDIIKSDGIDYVWDCNNGLPKANDFWRDYSDNSPAGNERYERTKIFRDNTVDEFLCKHFLEHLTTEGFMRLMDEMWDALKPDGALLVYVPNGEHVIAAHSDPTHRKVFTKNTMSYFTHETLAAYPYTDKPWKILEQSVNGTPPDDLWELYWKMQPDK